MKVLLLVSSFVFFSSFSVHLPLKVNKNVSSISQKFAFKKIVVGFQFDYGGCHYDLTAVIETTNGSGEGILIQTCGHGKPRSIAFDIYGANFARISASDLSNFRTDEGSYQPSNDELQRIVDGYNSNVPTE